MPPEAMNAAGRPRYGLTGWGAKAPEGSLGAQTKVAVQILKAVSLEALFFFRAHAFSFDRYSCSCVFQLYLRLPDREEGVLGRPLLSGPGQTLTGCQKAHPGQGTAACLRAAEERPEQVSGRASGD